MFRFIVALVVLVIDDMINNDVDLKEKTMSAKLEAFV